MNNDFTYTEQLIQYLDNELSQEEAQLLEQRLTKDTALQSELETLRLSQVAVRSLGLRQEVNSVHEEMMQERLANPARVEVMNRGLRIALQIAAGLIILVMAVAVYQYATVSPGKLFAEQYKAFTVPASRGEEITNPVETAWRNKEYDRAWRIYREGTVGKTPANSFFAAQSLVALNNIPAAIPVFEQVLQQNTQNNKAIYQEDAEYYLALCYLQNNQVEKAAPLFKSIYANTSHLYHDKTSYWFMKKLRLLQWKKS